MEEYPIEQSPNNATVEGLMQENNYLIQDCLAESNRLYELLTADNCLENKDEVKPTCIMANLIIQNEKLKKLRTILSTINVNVFKGGK